MIYRNIISRNIKGEIYIKKNKLFRLKKPYSEYWVSDTLDNITDKDFLKVLQENNLVKMEPPSCPIVTSNRLEKIHLQLNNTCMCHCSHCYVGDYEKAELNLNDIKEIFYEALECGVHTIEYSGGEPTLNKDFVEIIKFGKSLGLNQMLFTNGFIPACYISKIISYIDIVQISIDGPLEYHNTFRKNNQIFDKAMATIKALANKGIKIIISMSIVPENIKYIPFVYGLAMENKATFRVSPPAPVGRFSNNNMQSFYSSYLRKAKEICLDNNITLKEFVPTAPSCSALSKTVYINASKKVYPCPLLSGQEFFLGSLGEAPLRNIIENEQSLYILDNINSLKERVEKACFFCPAFLQNTQQECKFFGELI